MLVSEIMVVRLFSIQQYQQNFRWIHSVSPCRTKSYDWEILLSRIDFQLDPGFLRFRHCFQLRSIERDKEKSDGSSLWTQLCRTYVLSTLIVIVFFLSQWDRIKPPPRIHEMNVMVDIFHLVALIIDILCIVDYDFLPNVCRFFSITFFTTDDIYSIAILWSNEIRSIDNCDFIFIVTASFFDVRYCEGRVDE